MRNITSIIALISIFITISLGKCPFKMTENYLQGTECTQCMNNCENCEWRNGKSPSFLFFIGSSSGATGLKCKKCDDFYHLNKEENQCSETVFENACICSEKSIKVNSTNTTIAKKNCLCDNNTHGYFLVNETTFNSSEVSNRLTNSTFDIDSCNCTRSYYNRSGLIDNFNISSALDQCHCINQKWFYHFHISNESDSHNLSCFNNICNIKTQFGNFLNNDTYGKEGVFTQGNSSSFMVNTSLINDYLGIIQHNKVFINFTIHNDSNQHLYDYQYRKNIDNEKSFIEGNVSSNSSDFSSAYIVNEFDKDSDKKRRDLIISLEKFQRNSSHGFSKSELRSSLERFNKSDSEKNKSFSSVNNDTSFVATFNNESINGTFISKNRSEFEEEIKAGEKYEIENEKKSYERMYGNSNLSIMNGSFDFSSSSKSEDEFERENDDNKTSNETKYEKEWFQKINNANGSFNISRGNEKCKKENKTKENKDFTMNEFEKDQFNLIGNSLNDTHENSFKNYSIESLRRGPANNSLRYYLKTVLSNSTDDNKNGSHHKYGSYLFLEHPVIRKSNETISVDLDAKKTIWNVTDNNGSSYNNFTRYSIGSYKDDDDSQLKKYNFTRSEIKRDKWNETDNMGSSYLIIRENSTENGIRNKTLNESWVEPKKFKFLPHF